LTAFILDGYIAVNNFSKKLLFPKMSVQKCLPGLTTIARKIREKEIEKAGWKA